jgi:ElaB/YqjD/DUF883 family membrane-anchored ribosome-binding protein
MAEAKRQTLKQKVAAGQERNRARTKPESTTTIVDRAGERAIEAKDKFVEFAKEHPIATVAGGLAVGILLAGLFKAPRRAAIKGGSKAAALAAIGAEVALAYAQQAIEAASEAGRTGADKLDDLGDNARHLGRDAAERAGELGESARVAARDAGKRIAEAIRNRVN